MSDPSPTPPPSVEKASVIEDFVDIFMSPAAVYERRRDSSPWLPLIVVTVVLAIGYVASSGTLQPLMDAEFERGAREVMEKNPQMTPEAMAQGRAITQGIGKFVVLVGTPVIIALLGCLLWLTSKLVDAKQLVGTSVMIVAWAWMPKIIGSLLTAIQLQFMEVNSLDGMRGLSIGPARFLDPDTASPIVVALAQRLDVFTLWPILLMAIGVSVVARVPRSSGWLAAGAIWLLGSLQPLYSALMK